MAGVALGVTALIVSLSIMNGFERDLKKALIGASAHLTIAKFNFQDLSGINESNIKIEKIKHLITDAKVTPYTHHQGLIMGKDKPRGVMIRGIDIQAEIQNQQLFPFLYNTTYEGKLTESESKEVLGNAPLILKQLQRKLEKISNSKGEIRNVNVSGIILGTTLANQLSVFKGNFVTLISPEERISPTGPLPILKKFKVVGFIEGMSGFDEVITYIDIKDAQKIFRMKDKVSGLSIFIKDPDRADSHLEILQKSFPFPFYVSSWTQSNKNLFVVMKLEKLALSFILTFIILVAAFNIISSLTMMVIEKQKDISILKSIGATNRSIRRIFMIQGAIIGLIGTSIGEILGILVCIIIKNFDLIEIPANVYPGKGVPMHLIYWQLILIGVLSFSICFIATIIPSYKASNVHPVDGLRYE